MRDIVVSIPEGISLKCNDNHVIVEGPKGKLERSFKGVKITCENSTIHVEAKQPAMINTVKRHVNNMIIGVKDGYRKTMVIRYSHFPIKVKINNDYVIIENFLGERKARKARIMGNVKVSVKGNNVIVEGLNKEDVTQTVANIRQTTKIKHKDERIFQDGIYPEV